MTNELTIDPEFAALIPPLSHDELAGLESDIISHGCRVPLDVWNGVLIDGHTRYSICQKHTISFETKAIEFADRNAAIVWICTNQLARRNLSSFARVQIALRMEDVYKAQAKTRQVAHGGTAPGKKSLPPNWAGVIDDPAETRDKVAKDAGVGKNTVDRVKVILEQAAPEVKDAVTKGDMSINEAYKMCKKQKKKASQQDRNQKAIITSQFEGIDLRQGDFRVVLADIPDGSVDLILTDPPYTKECLPLWDDLGKFAYEKLSAEGVLIAYSGTLFLPNVMAALSAAGLTYYWTLAIINKGSGGYLFWRHIKIKWKPVLIFTKQQVIDAAFEDIIEGSGPEKDKHNWQQPINEARHLIKTFMPKANVVVDPFAGSGAFLEAARLEGLPAIGAELLEVANDNAA